MYVAVVRDFLVFKSLKKPAWKATIVQKRMTI